MPRLTDQEQQEIIRFIEADKLLPEKIIASGCLKIVVKNQVVSTMSRLSKSNHSSKRTVSPNEDNGKWEELWTGNHIFENEWQSFRTKKDRSLELQSVFHECTPGRRKLAVKVVDIFGNDTMTIVEVRI